VYLLTRIGTYSVHNRHRVIVQDVLKLTMVIFFTKVHQFDLVFTGNENMP